MTMTIGICGFIGSGKDTVANHLVSQYGFQRERFATTLKDAVAAIFGWDRDLLEGLTKESIAWRNQVDPWWAKRLDIPHLTPRWVMQVFGTDVMRKAFHDDIWIASLENKLRKLTKDATIPDVRFPNEFRSLEGQDGIVLRVKNGPEPEWFDAAIIANTSPDPVARETAAQHLKGVGIHFSEWAWIGQPLFDTLENDGTLDDLYRKVDAVVARYKAQQGQAAQAQRLAA